ncbi:SDR family NAD(P)-dependent oxidoreductase [Halobacillus salinus]|uniref:SDR family NAD(P)-dependent oxidoreductase n=1 Tax=Halobacillus salinus TaxID=192814 RepID=UPI0009A7A34E|nr:SDR family oxidoreductase [Halobacillus salinus]
MKRVAIVTGSSRGLGKAVSRRLSSDGVRVVVNYYSNQEKAEEVVAEIERDGGEAVAIQGDVTTEEGADRVVGEAERVFGQSVDIVVNNATGPQPELSLEEVSWEDYLDQLHFSVKAPLLLTKRVMGGMKRNHWGRIINIGSEVVGLGNAEFSNYVTAKSAVVGMTRSWANELGAFGITVNAVHPGFIPVERHGEVTEESAQGYVSGVPLKHLGKPEDIAAQVAFLCRDEGGFMTGQNISVNGGKTFGV